VVSSLLSAAAWALANGWPGARSAAGVLAFNTLTQAVAFTTVGLLLAELRRRLDVERALSRVDPLTLLPNRRAFLEQADLLMAVAQRYEHRMTLAFIDLDGFKAVNDEQGHAAGDAVLREVADVLRGEVRASDLLARLGGDEFAVLLCQAGPDVAREVLERLRERLVQRLSARGWPVTASIGALSFASPPPRLDAALAQADALMYEAKATGKNRVHVGCAGSPPA
jgi:diguanylate cyclase (GGDEF)-like protein